MLAKAIVLVLLIKLVGIGAVRIYMATDNPAPAIDANAMARLFGVAPVHQSNPIGQRP